MGLYDTDSFGMTGPRRPGPTVGSLEDAIQIEHSLSQLEKREALEQLRRDLGNVSRSTPLMAVIPRIGGGILGMIIARFFNMSLAGQVLTTLGGYGLGKAVGNFYNNNDDGINWVR